MALKKTIPVPPVSETLASTESVTIFEEAVTGIPAAPSKAKPLKPAEPQAVPKVMGPLGPCRPSPLFPRQTKGIF